MVSWQVKRYIRHLKHQGYSSSAIKSSLLRAGYSGVEVTAALKSTEKHTGLVIGASALVGILLVLGIVFFLRSSGNISLSLHPETVEVEQGSDITFTRAITTTRDDTVLVVYDIVHAGTNTITTTKQENTLSGTDTIRLPISTDVRAGRYTVKAMASYKGKKETATFSFNVVAQEASTPIVQEVAAVIQETTAELKQICGDCDDFDSCTTDSCVEGSCVHDSIALCCGNGLCEEEETAKLCAIDCGEVIVKSGEDIINDAARVVKSNNARATQLCDSLAKGTDADQCYISLAEKSEEYVFCGDVVDETKRDTCYMDFALSKNEFDVCPELGNRYLRNSCFSLKNLRALQVQV
jgi:hypothetical protein